MFLSEIRKEPNYLRMYDTFHSNDPEEGKYLLNRWMQAGKNPIGEMNNTSPCAYVASFIKPDGDVTRTRDNLAFWRAYGDDGAGCSLTVKLPADKLFKVVYGEDAGQNLLRILNFIKEALRPVLDIASPDADCDVRVAKGRLLGKLQELASPIHYLHKSDAYKYEREVRALATTADIESDQITFERIDNSDDVRHYYERDDLHVRNLLVSGSVITIGPCVPNGENFAYYLEYLKRQSGLIGPKICQSKVSYRNN